MACLYYSTSATLPPAVNKTPMSAQVEDPTRFEELPNDEQVAPSERTEAAHTEPNRQQQNSSSSESGPTDDPIPTESQELKREGNQAFAQREWENALSLWQEALLKLPPLMPPQGKQARRSSASQQARADGNNHDDDEEPTNRKGEEEEALGQPSEAVKSLRAALTANIAAACLKLERWEEATQACTQGLSHLVLCLFGLICI